MSNNPGFDILKEAFKKFAAKYANEDMAGKGVRIAAAGAKAVVDSAKQEFPKSFVNQVAKDLYALLTSQEVADGVSASVRAFDEEKVKDLVDGLVSKLKDPAVSIKIAQQFKQLLKQSEAAGVDITDQIEGLLDQADLPMGQKLIAQALLAQVKPILDEMKDASDEEVAAKLGELADMIPSDMIAAQVGQLTRGVTPEAVSGQAHDLVGKLPSPQTVADIAHDVADEASKTFDQISKSGNVADAKELMSQFVKAANDVVKNAVAKDKAAKKTFNNKKGGSFDL